jgi:ClpP class serine protease
MPTEIARMSFDHPGMLALAKKAWGAEHQITIKVSAEVDGPKAFTPGPAFTRTEDMAIVDIPERGRPPPLVNRKHPVWDSYEGILERVASAFADTLTKRVCLRVNSPGGDVDGCFDAARALRAMRVSHDKELVAWVDGQAASAAYALSCGADRILLSSTSTVGSIGIIEGLRDQTVLDRATGQNFVIVASGEHKSDGNPHVAITEKAVANLKAQVDGMADLFFDLVEELRGFPAEKARALEARMLFGEQAVGAGLADEVTTWSALAHEAVSTAQPGAGVNMGAKAMNLRQHMAWAAEHGDDEEKEMAKRCLSALEEGEGDEGAPPEKKKEDKKASASAESEGEGKKAAKSGEEPPEKKKEEKEAKAKAESEGEGKKAAAEEPKKEEKEAKASKSEGEGEGKKAQAASALAARVQALEAENYAREQGIKRAALMASRPDLAPEVVAWLDAEPIGVVERAIKTLPKGKARAAVTGPATASQTMGTRAAGHTGDPADASHVPDDESGFIARKMGLEVPGKGIVNTGKSLEMGFMTPEQAKAFLDKKMKPAGAPGAKGDA